MAQISKINQLSIGDMLTSSKKTASSQSKFSDIMSSSTSSKQDTTKQGASTESVHTAKAKLEDGNASIHKPEQSNAAETEEIRETETANEAGSETISEEAAETVEVLKEQIAGILSISKEELDKIMAESGLTAMDLLQPDVLKSLVLQVNGSTEPTDLLTNESLCNQLTDLLHAVEEFVQTTDMEQFAAVLEVLEPQDFEAVMKEQDVKSEKPADTEPVAELDETVSDKGAVKEAVITVQKEVTAENEDSSFGRNDSKEDADTSNTQLNQFIQNLTDSIQESGQVTMESAERLQQMQEIVEQVVERIKVTLSADTTSMELQLNPENLGKVNVSVISKNGEMTATFTVENQLAKEALESQMTTLKDNLHEQGIKVDAIEVTVAQHGFSQNEFSDQSQHQFQNQTKRNSNFARMNKEEEMSEEVEEESVNPDLGTGTVDFSA